MIANDASVHEHVRTQRYLQQVTQLAHHIMTLYHEKDFQAGLHQEQRLSGLISASRALKPEWHEPLERLHRTVFEYSLGPCHRISPDAYLMHRACLAFSSLSEQQEAA